VQLAFMTSVSGQPQGLAMWARALAAVTPEDVARLAKTLTPARRDVITLVATPEREGSPEPGAKKPAAKKDGGAK
jgi:hypothetical protein